MQTIDDYVAQEIFGADLGESFVEVNDDRLFDSQNAQGFDFLIERLQERRRRFRMQDGSRMGIGAGLTSRFAYVRISILPTLVLVTIKYIVSMSKPMPEVPNWFNVAEATNSQRRTQCAPYF